MVRRLVTLALLVCSFSAVSVERVKWEQGQEIGVELKNKTERKR